MDATDATQFLAASPDRLALLGRLREAPGAPADLAEDLDISRRSVQRNLGEFVDRGWAYRDAGEYRTTTTGAVVAVEHADYLDALDLIDTFGDLYRHLPDADHAPDPRWLSGAEMVGATADDPQAPVHFYISRVKTFDGDRIRMVSPVLSRLFHDAHAELAFRGVHTELVLSADTVARARERNRAEFDVVVSVDVLDLYRHPETVGFGLTVGEDRLLMSAYDEGGHLQACVESSDDRFLDWAERLFETYCDGAERVEPTINLPFSLQRD